MSRTYDRLAARAAGGRLVEVAKVVEVRGGDAIGAKDRPGHLTGASDQDVVEWAKRGHEAAFRELVRRYERPVFSLLYRMVRDRGLAEDLAQETFIKVLNGLGSYNPQYRSCIRLRHVEGHSYEEIARILELPLGTVKTYIHRARNELRGYLADRKE